jgi:hypothetical protein
VATSITTQADVLTYGLITDNEIHSLTTERMKSDNWATLHERAWTKVLDQLALRASPIEETDLSDTSELKPATVFVVLHYAYAQAEFMNDENQKRSELYWLRAMKELEEVRLSVTTGTASRGGFSYRRARRM